MLVLSMRLAASGDRPYSFTVQRRRHTMKPDFDSGSRAAADCRDQCPRWPHPARCCAPTSCIASPARRPAWRARAAKGASVTVLAKQGGWLRVTAGKTTGWMRLLSVRVGAGGLSSSGLGDVVGAATTQSDPSRVVAVAGLRGLNEEDLKKATFNADELARLDAWVVTPAQSKKLCQSGGAGCGQCARLAKPAFNANPNPRRHLHPHGRPTNENQTHRTGCFACSH